MGDARGQNNDAADDHAHRADPQRYLFAPCLFLLSIAPKDMPRDGAIQYLGNELRRTHLLVRAWVNRRFGAINERFRTHPRYLLYGSRPTCPGLWRTAAGRGAPDTAHTSSVRPQGAPLRAPRRTPVREARRGGRPPRSARTSSASAGPHLSQAGR